MPGYRRICFDLPETLDGTQCSVSLDVMYKTMPFRLDSNVAKGLTRDLKLLSESKLEVLQLVPISLVDSSLIHGVVMGVRAGLETDLDRHNETALLVRSLFRHLSSKACALLLRSEGPSNIESDGLFHCNGQSFLLIAEELPAPLKTKAAPNSGVLYRYAASADQLFSRRPSQQMSYRISMTTWLNNTRNLSRIPSIVWIAMLSIRFISRRRGREVPRINPLRRRP
jgi:hypothetical protein